jgi:hypothetical protein
MLSLLLLACLLLACADDTPAWAVQHASVVPTSTGMTGTQTWEFFNSEWKPERGEKDYLCVRAQTVTGTLTTSTDCPGCRAIWVLAVSELDSDCPDSLVEDASFSGPDVYAIGEVDASFADDDPYPDRSFGWAAGFGDGELAPMGWAWPEALELEGDAAPGWALDRPYTLWPAVAWQL